jgi:O-antigen ligase
LRVLRPQLSGATMAVALLGCALVLLGAFLSTRIDAEIGVGLALLAAVFVVAATCGFLAYPHLAVAATVAVFALVPLLRWFTWPEVGGLKDLLVIAAFAAAVIVFAYERRLPDRWILILVAALLGLYAVNVGGGHGAEWAHGVRLVGEPLLLLLAGLMLPEPRRTFRYAMGALIITGCVVAAYGIVQQVAGPWTLVESWGYSFTEQVQILSDGQLRSFGTLDDAFAYAALLAFGVAAAIFWLRRGPLAWAVALLMLAGLAFSFVRTGALILVALAAVALARREYGFRENIAIVALLITVAMALAIGGETRDTPGERGQAQATTESDVEDPAGGTVGGRVEVWRNAIGSDPAEWLVGRGVGEAGTAASRASDPTIPSGDAAGPTESVDSGYVAAIVDVGVIGFAVLLGLLARLIVLAVRATGQKLIEGWIALALLVSLVVDALTRSSFTGFPTAFLCLFLVGIALAAAAEIRPPPNGLRSFTR